MRKTKCTSSLLNSPHACPAPVTQAQHGLGSASIEQKVGLLSRVRHRHLRNGRQSNDWRGRVGISGPRRIRRRTRQSHAIVSQDRTTHIATSDAKVIRARRLRRSCAKPASQSSSTCVTYSCPRSYLV